jgi:hypothetical protein
MLTLIVFFSIFFTISFCLMRSNAREPMAKDDWRNLPKAKRDAIRTKQWEKDYAIYQTLCSTQV